MTAHPTEAEVGPMNDLMRAVLENPFDDGPRLVYADWLDEHDSPEQAEFIRVQIELAKHPWGRRMYDPRYSSGEPWDSLREREKRVWNFGMPGTWADALKPSFECVFCIDLETISRDKTRDPLVVFRRGFPSSVSLTLAALCGGPCERCEGTGEHPPPSFGYAAVGQCQHCRRADGKGRVGGLAAALSRWPVTAVNVTDFRYERAHPAIAGALFKRVQEADGMLDVDEIASRFFVDYVRSLAEPPLAGLRWK